MPTITELLPYGGSASYQTDIFASDESAMFMAELIATTAWRSDSIQFYGKRYPIPRQTAWFGDPGARYTYSRIVHEPEPWTPALLAVKQRVEAIAGVAFNSVLVNRYRTGSDSNAWHSDNEPELGSDPVIGSVSFGATRRFEFQNRSDPAIRIKAPLENGSVIIMRGACQTAWQHRIPKERRVTAERINLTFRTIVPPRG